MIYMRILIHLLKKDIESSYILMLFKNLIIFEYYILHNSSITILFIFTIIINEKNNK